MVQIQGAKKGLSIHYTHASTSAEPLLLGLEELRSACTQHPQVRGGGGGEAKHRTARFQLRPSPLSSATALCPTALRGDRGMESLPKD